MSPRPSVWPEKGLGLAGQGVPSPQSCEPLCPAAFLARTHKALDGFGLFRWPIRDLATFRRCDRMYVPSILPRRLRTVLRAGAYYHNSFMDCDTINEIHSTQARAGMADPKQPQAHRFGPLTFLRESTTVCASQSRSEGRFDPVLPLHHRKD